MKLDELLRESHERLRRAFGDRLDRVILYGSTARGEDTADSDIDLLVVLNEPVDWLSATRTIIDTTYPLQLESDRALSLKPMSRQELTQEQSTLARMVNQDGITVPEEASSTMNLPDRKKEGIMRPTARDWWVRAKQAFDTAGRIVEIDPDAAASRAYYAAFYAVSGLLETRSLTFRKHSAIESAVHQQLVHTGEWPTELGKRFSQLADLRVRGDYGGARHVSTEEARDAVEAARQIIEQVRLSGEPEFAD